MNLTINKYVTEVYKELSKLISENHKILIEAPTESGKSTFVKNFIKNNLDKHIVFAIPTRILVHNLGNEEEIKSGYGKYLLSLLDKDII